MRDVSPTDIQGGPVKSKPQFLIIIFKSYWNHVNKASQTNKIQWKETSEYYQLLLNILCVI